MSLVFPGLPAFSKDILLYLGIALMVIAILGMIRKYRAIKSYRQKNGID